MKGNGTQQWYTSWDTEGMASYKDGQGKMGTKQWRVVRNHCIVWFGGGRNKSDGGGGRKSLDGLILILIHIPKGGIGLRRDAFGIMYRIIRPSLPVP